jgi:hypothetical protein
MPKQVVNSAKLKCSMGMAPSSLIVLPVHMLKVGDQPAANIYESSGPCEHPSFWYVPVAGQPDGRCGDRRCHGGSDAHAVHSEYSVPLGPWVANRATRQYAGA